MTPRGRLVTQNTRRAGREIGLLCVQGFRWDMCAAYTTSLGVHVSDTVFQSPCHQSQHKQGNGRLHTTFGISQAATHPEFHRHMNLYHSGIA